jgi:predicted nucleotidyltransferase
MIIQDLVKKNIINPPKWLPDNVVYLILGGSNLYGVSPEDSDQDITGFCIPPKDDVFPHLKGEIQGFGRQKNRFENWQHHNVIDNNALGGKGREYDFSIYSIVRYFSLAMANNPTTMEILWAPENCVLHCTPIGRLIRENRNIFPSKKIRHTYLGYAFNQVKKAKSQERTGKRKDIVDKYGFDVKFASHVVRLLNQGISFLTTGDVDLQADKEILKSVRRGEWTLERIEEYLHEREQEMSKLYIDSSLPYAPDEAKIKDLLIECLNLHYKDIDSSCVVVPSQAESALRAIKETVDKYYGKN